MWSTIPVSGKSVLIHEPPTAPRAGVLFLLDEGQPPFVWPAFRSFVESSPDLWIFAFPESSWWCEETVAAFHPEFSPADFIRKHLFAWLRERLGPRASIALSGGGCGGQTALKIAFDDPVQFPTVAVFDPAIDLFELHGQGTNLDLIYPDRERLRQQSAYLYLRSYPWPEALWIAYSPDSLWHRGIDRLHEKLNVLGVLHHYLTRPGDPLAETWLQGSLLQDFAYFFNENLAKPVRMKLL